MPLYEYRCQSCGADEEKLQAVSAPETHDCPACGVASGMKRQLSVAAFALSGGGWYAEGYGKEPGKEKASPAKAAEAVPAAGDKAGGDKAAAEKPVAKAPEAKGGHACGGACACAS
ncbi:MAG: zinc ribbon domain-containing protein [Acidobacteria bacterium]|nr:zinc ribbon domain-containing protein [Acidobacteriota bacterium]